MLETIPFALPDISQREIEAVTNTLRSGYLTCGPKALEFENLFRNYIGCTHALAVNSATSGLHLALLSLGVGTGDKVVIPVNTFTATANAISYAGAIPIFCDIDEQTFNIDINCLKNILSDDTENQIKIVLPVHVAGQSVDMDALLQLKKRYGFHIIEDAAHAFTTVYKNRKIGTIGDITVFSFYPTKTLATCDGGMVCTNDEKIAKKIRILKNNGIDTSLENFEKMRWNYDVEDLGYKYGMNDVAATLGIVQLSRADDLLRKRKKIADFYDESLKNIQSVTTPFISCASDIHSRHLYIIKIPNRDKVYSKLYEQGIRTSVHFKPLHLHSYWKKKFQYEPNDFKTAQNVFEKVLSLPIYTQLEDFQLERIAHTLKKILS